MWDSRFFGKRRCLTVSLGALNCQAHPSLLIVPTSRRVRVFFTAARATSHCMPRVEWKLRNSLNRKKAAVMAQSPMPVASSHSMLCTCQSLSRRDEESATRRGASEAVRPHEPAPPLHQLSGQMSAWAPFAPSPARCTANSALAGLT